MNTNNTAPTVASIFSGCGGLDVGFKELGFDLVYACDNDPAAVACFGFNVDSRVFLRDVRSDDFHADMKRLGTADVVLGGFPCQGFSKAGPKRSSDARNVLYLEMHAAVALLRPTVFIAENVDGITQNFGGLYVRRIVDDFSAIGYRVEQRILEAGAFGLPQYRRRMFFVGVRNDVTLPFEWPTRSHSIKSRNGESKVQVSPQLWDEIDSQMPKSKATIGDAISDLLDIDAPMPDHVVTGKWPRNYDKVFRSIAPGQKLCNVRHAPSSVRTWDIPDVFGSVSPTQRTILEIIARNRRHKEYGDIPNGNPMPIDEIERLSNLTNTAPTIESLLDKGYLKRIGSGVDLKGAMFCSGMFKRPLWDEPAPTVLTNFHNPRYFLHPIADRPFSLRECARLQGFDDQFLFQASGVDVVSGYRLVGNAVPPPLSRRFASAILCLLERTRTTPALATR